MRGGASHAGPNAGLLMWRLKDGHDRDVNKSTVHGGSLELAWGLGLRIEPSKRSNNNNNHNRGRGRPSERGTDGQLDTTETQPCSGTLPLWSRWHRPYLPPASLRCLLIRVEAAPAGEVRAKEPSRPCEKAPQIS